MAAGTGIGWANAGADMSRYQHRSVKAVRLVASAAFGAGIPLVLLITLGGLLSVGNNDLASATDPIIAIRDMLPTWMAVPYLITAFGALLLSNNLSVYSAGLTTLTLGLKVKRVHAVIVDIVAIFAGSIYFMLIADSFYGPFITFISLLAVPITAWVGIFVVDLIHRHYYSAKDLLDVTPSSARPPASSTAEPMIRTRRGPRPRLSRVPAIAAIAPTAAIGSVTRPVVEGLRPRPRSSQIGQP